MIVKLKCCICGNGYEGEYDDACPICGWCNSGVEEQLYEDDEYDAYNCTTRVKAKTNYAKGLNKWGEPIKSK